MLANAVRAVDDADRDVGAHLWHTPLDAARRNDVGGLLAALAEPSGDALWLRGPAAAAVPVPLDEPEPSDGERQVARCRDVAVRCVRLRFFDYCICLIIVFV